MLESTYTQSIVAIAKKRLEEVQKPLSQKELCRNIVSVLKKTLGKADTRHTSKLRFTKEIFPFVLNDSLWQDAIILTKEKKYELLSRASPPELSSLNSPNSNRMQLDDAITELICILKKIDPLKLEELVRVLIERKFGYKARLTPKSHDGGIDIIAIKDDETAYSGKTKKMLILVQVKRYDKTVGREYGDRFLGALQKHRQNRQWSKFDCFFITTSNLAPSFQKHFKDSEPEGVSFSCWDGYRLARYLIETGIGSTFAIDYDFWEKQY